MYYEQSFQIDTRDVDHRGQCRPSALLGHLQEAATGASVALGNSREIMLERHNAFWMLARLMAELERPLYWGSSLTVRTWHRAPQGASIYRDFDLFVEGERVGQAVSTWVLADKDSRKLVRMDRVLDLLEGNRAQELEKTTTLSRLKLPQDMELAETRRLRYSESDINGHINNTRYADYACDALRMEELDGERFVRRIRIGFLAECRPGETLELYVGREDGECFVKGVGADQKARFETALLL